MSVKPTFQGEIQLAGWSESHTGGCKVVFWLADPSELEAFRAMTVRKGNTAGQRLACVLVEIGDDEQPVTPPAPAPKPAEAEQRASKPIARWLAVRCKDREFQSWLCDEVGAEYYDEGLTVEWVRDLCGVSSRGLIDGNAEAEGQFQRLIRGPWLKHCLARGIHQE